MRDPLSYSGVIATAVLFALGTVIWPAPENSCFAERAVHAVLPVVLVVLGLPTVSFVLRLLMLTPASRRRWAVSLRIDAPGQVEVELQALRPVRMAVASGQIEACVKTPSGDFIMARQGLVLFGGVLDRRWLNARVLAPAAA